MKEKFVSTVGTVPIQPSVTWEHEHLAQVRVKVLRGHTKPVKSVQFCDSDKKILTASWDKTAILWDSASGTQIHSFTGHEDKLSKARSSPDHTRIVSSSWDRTIRVWDVQTGSILWTGHHDGIVTCCNFSNDGAMVISGSDDESCVKIWDAESGELIFNMPTLHSQTVTSCRFTPSDNRVLTTSYDKSTKIWDLKAKKSTIILKGHINVIADASMTNDEHHVATVSWDKSILIWDVATGGYRTAGPQSFHKAHEGSISSCKYSKDGLSLVTGGFDNSLNVWDIDNSVRVLRLQGHSDWIEDVDYSNDQNWLLSASQDKTVRLWNITEGDQIPLVIETRKSIGLKMHKCEECGKPFSINTNEKAISLCVFCRLKQPDRNEPNIVDSEDIEELDHSNIE